MVPLTAFSVNDHVLMHVPPVMYGKHGPLRPLSQSAAALPDEHECLMFKCKFQPDHLAGATAVHNNKPVFMSYGNKERTNVITEKYLKLKKGKAEDKEVNPEARVFSKLRVSMLLNR